MLGGARPCPAQGCEGIAREGHLLCGSCWRQVPAPLAAEVSRSWHAYTHGNPHQAALGLSTWRRAAAAAVVSVALGRGAKLYLWALPQPWAWAVAHGGLRVVPQPAPAPAVGLGIYVAVQATREVDAQGLRVLRDLLHREPGVQPQDAVVAVTNVVDSPPASEVQDMLAIGAYAWRLAGALPLEPVPCVQREPYAVPTREVLAQIRTAWKAAQQAPRYDQIIDEGSR